MIRQTQSKKLLEILNDGAWHCTNEFYSVYMSDPRTIICQLKKRGYKFQWRWCIDPKHNHQGHSKQWMLLYAQNLTPSSRNPEKIYKTTAYRHGEDRDGFKCDCPGFKGWGQCKHVEELKKKLKVGIKQEKSL